MKNVCTSVLLLLSSILSGQTPVEVWKGAVKISSVSEEQLYFGFAGGDKLLFDFQEIAGRELKEFEITEWPQSSKFIEYNTNKINRKQISIPRTAIYQFRLTNRSISERVCRLQIWRIPGSASPKKFNTSVEWKTAYDTTYIPSIEKYLMRKDTSIFNREVLVTVNAQTNTYGPRQFPDFDLPENTVSWSYYIGVNQQGQQAFQDATQKLSQTASPLLTRIPGYGPLAALALSGIPYFTQLQKGEDITYYIIDGANAMLARQQQPFQFYRSNKVINDFAAMKAPLAGKYYFYLYNDNSTTGLDVIIKVAAIVVTERWAERPVQKMNRQTKKIPVLKPDVRPVETNRIN